MCEDELGPSRSGGTSVIIDDTGANSSVLSQRNPRRNPPAQIRVYPGGGCWRVHTRSCFTSFPMPGPRKPGPRVPCLCPRCKGALVSSRTVRNHRPRTIPTPIVSFPDWYYAYYERPHTSRPLDHLFLQPLQLLSPACLPNLLHLLFPQPVQPVPQQQLCALYPRPRALQGNNPNNLIMS
jgi:hypothetical protein